MPSRRQYRPRKVTMHWHENNEGNAKPRDNIGPEEVAAGIAALQAGWDEEEWYKRAGLEYDPDIGGQPVEMHTGALLHKRE